MTRGVKLATFGASRIALDACAAPDHDTDTQVSLEAHRAPAQRRAQSVAQALRGLGGPLAGSVAGAAESRRVKVLVAPHGTYNRGP
jgi:hypothetical protein